jgi:hypothetical protein
VVGLGQNPGQLIVAETGPTTGQKRYGGKYKGRLDDPYKRYSY